MGLRYSRRHLLQAKEPLLVNPVNTVGVMGSGVALRFRQAYPDLFAAYQQACAAGCLGIGRAHLWVHDGVSVVNLPTKRHYRSPTRLEWVEAGLACIARLAPRYDAVAMTRLGCGAGGLHWETQVRPLVESVLVRGAGMAVVVYTGTIPPQQPATVSGAVTSEIVGGIE